MANINQWKVGDIISATKLNEMVNAINSLLQQEIPGIDTSNLITTEQLTTILQGYSDVGHTHNISEIVDLVLPTVPTKVSQLENDSNFISSIPEEYVTEQELNAKGLATETYVQNKIAEAQLGGGGGTAVDLSGLGADLSLNGQTLKLKNSNGAEIGTGVTLPQTDLTNYYTKTETDNIIQDYTGGKKQVYLTQAEYDLLSDTEKNDSTKVYNIVDAIELIVPQDLNLDSNNLLQLKDKDGNKIGTGVLIPNTYTLPPATADTLGGIKVGNRLSIDSNGVLSADLQESSSIGGTANEVILTSPGGYRFKLIVSDEGALSTEEIVIYGNILASISELSINEGESKTFTVSLSQVPTRPQTITIASNNTDVTVNPSSIDISDTNPHTITVIAGEDEDYDDDIAILTLSSPNVPNVTINVTVIDNDVQQIPCESIGLSHSVLSLEQGKTEQITTILTPSNTTDAVVWSTSNANCTVDNGLVRAVNIGECIITATCGGKSATCTVTVTAKQSIGGVTEDGYIASGLAVQLVCDDVTEGDTVWTDRTGNEANATVTYKSSGEEGEVADTKLHKDTDGAILMTANKTYMTIPKEKIPSEGKTIELVYGNIIQWEPIMSIANKIVFNHTIGTTGYCLCVNNHAGFIKAYNAYASLGNKTKRVISVTVESNKVVVYENGNLIETIEYNFSDYLTFTENFVMNTRAGSALGTDIKNGKYYALRVYNRVLSAEEIAANAAIDKEKYLLS